MRSSGTRHEHRRHHARQPRPGRLLGGLVQRLPPPRALAAAAAPAQRGGQGSDAIRRAHLHETPEVHGLRSEGRSLRELLLQSRDLAPHSNHSQPPCPAKTTPDPRRPRRPGAAPAIRTSSVCLPIDAAALSLRAVNLSICAEWSAILASDSDLGEMRTRKRHVAKRGSFSWGLSGAQTPCLPAIGRA